MRIPLLLWLILQLVGAQEQERQYQVTGCDLYCGIGYAACIRRCKEALRIQEVKMQTMTFNTTDSEELFLKVVPIARLPSDVEITGSDGFTYTKSGMQFLTSRDGRVWRMIPSPRSAMSVMTEVYTIPDFLNLDTTLDKGLYDITFARNFKNTSLMYLLFSTFPVNKDLYDHDNVVAEFKFNHANHEITFQKVIHRMPQTRIKRSGGFMKASSEISTEESSPLWLSCGGNQYADSEIAKNHPFYSSIYGIYPESMKAIHVKQNLQRQAYVWATGVQNPFECDYAALRESDKIYCLTGSYNTDGEMTTVRLQAVQHSRARGEATWDSGSTATNTGTSKTATGSTSKLVDPQNILYSPIYRTFHEDRECLPQSILYSMGNQLPRGYKKRLIVAFPSCMRMNFAPQYFSMVVRSSSTRTWELMEMPIDFGGRLLVNIQLIGSERARGMFFTAYDLRTGEQDLYIVRSSESKQFSDQLTSFTSQWSFFT